MKNIAILIYERKHFAKNANFSATLDIEGCYLSAICLRLTVSYLVISYFFNSKVHWSVHFIYSASNLL
jgi:hypothetical protein